MFVQQNASNMCNNVNSLKFHNSLITQLLRISRHSTLNTLGQVVRSNDIYRLLVEKLRLANLRCNFLLNPQRVLL